MNPTSWTIQQLIDNLNKIEDKSKVVWVHQKFTGGPIQEIKELSDQIYLGWFASLEES